MCEMKSEEKTAWRYDESMNCNRCGKMLNEKNGIVLEDYICVHKNWGYFSKKDGVTYEFVLCECCMDEITEGFKIPVEHHETTELI
ncbi:MAG: hypothetical protein Q4D51_01305 [Eubacteriales bacterium]|nr:hypothetical protein [Eubacteriales bacterium]